MSRRRFCIIYNPSAGRPAASALVCSVAEGLRARGCDVRLERTRRQGHATKLAAIAVADGYGTVVAAGGDGTVNEIVQSLAGTDAVFGVIPAGTVNLWASEAGAPKEAGGLVRFLTEGQVRRADVGKAGDRWFLLMASFGVDAAVVGAVSTRIKRVIGRWAYAVAAAAVLPRYRGTELRLILDGRVTDCTALMVVVGNTRRYAGPFRATAHAVADDGMLDVVVVRGGSVWGGLPQAGAVASGLSVLRSALFYGRARVVEVQAKRPLPLQVDGDFGGVAPGCFETWPHALRVITNDGPNSLFAGVADRAAVADELRQGALLAAERERRGQSTAGAR